MKDSVHCIHIGRLGWLKNQVVIIGGNSSVTVFDHEGNELYWTVASDSVRAVAAFDFDGDAENEVRIPFFQLIFDIKMLYVSILYIIYVVCNVIYYILGVQINFRRLTKVGVPFFHN